MSILNLPYDTFGVMFFQDTGPNDPDATLGTAAIFTTNGITYYRDINGVKFPLVPGANGSGVVIVTHAMSPYAVLDTDRYLLVDTSGGTVNTLLPTAGGASRPNPIQYVDYARSFGTNSLTITGNGHNIDGAATLVVNGVDACPLLFWAKTTWETQPGTATAPFNPAAPGAIGGTTPAAITGTRITATSGFTGPIGDVTPGAGIFTALTANTDLVLPTASVPTLTSGTVKIFSPDGGTVGILDQAGDQVRIVNNSSSGTAKIYERYQTASIGSAATLDVPLSAGSLGGHGTITAAGATSSVSGSFSFAANAATTLNGLTYTSFVATATASKLSVEASGGALRITNNLVGTQTVLIRLTELAAV